MNKLPVLLSGLVLLIASGVLGQDVDYNFDKAADFSKFKTYQWITLENELPIDKLT